MMRGSEKTATEAITSDGIATSKRLRMYLRTGSFRSRPVLLVRPGDHESPAIVETDVGREVLDVGLPGREHLGRRADVEVVGLLRAQALDVPDDLAPLLLVERPALELEHVGELG